MEKSDSILVTGCEGLVGSALMERLAEDGFYNVVGIGRREMDLRLLPQTAKMFKALQPKHVIHTAAFVRGILGNMEAQAQSYFENTLINTNVIEASRYAGAEKVTAMGTGAIYPYPPPTLPLREDMIFDGRPHPSESGYAHAKRGMLAMLEAYKQSYGLDFAYIVSGNLFGPRDKFGAAGGHVIPSLIKKFHAARDSNHNVTIWGDGSAQRDFMYVMDAARAIVLIADSFSGPINMGSGSVWRIEEIVRVLTKISGLPPRRVVWDSSKPNGQEHRAYDLSKLQALGFTKAWSIPHALEKTWEWYCHEQQNSN